MTGQKPHESEPGAAPERKIRENGRVRARLLEAAERMAGDEYKLPRLAFSLREIAREVGIATPSIYRHFSSKEALISATVETGFQELLAEMERADREFHGDALARVQSQAVAYCTFLHRRRGLARTMFATHPTNWQPGVPFTNYLGRLDRRWRVLLDDCRRNGFTLPGDPEQTAANIWATVHGNLSLALIAPEEDEQRLIRSVEAYFEMLRTMLSHDETSTTSGSGSAHGSRTRPSSPRAEEPPSHPVRQEARQ